MSGVFDPNGPSEAAPLLSLPGAQRVVSVIIGTRNRPDTLREALKSIRALEGPDLTFQICIGDNGTTPETRDIAAEFGALYGTTDVYGCPAARNVAMRMATGEYIAFLDDDDVWLPGHIRPHVALLENRADLDAVFSQYVFTDPDLKPFAAPFPPDPPDDGDYFAKMLNGYFPQVGSSVFRGDCIRRYGLMDEALIGDSDWDWQLRIARTNRVGFVPVPAILFRGRPPRSSDALQFKRAYYTSLIFLRFAIPAWKRMGGPIALLKAHARCVEYYYTYFCTGAESYAAEGHRATAFLALWKALVISPPRAARDAFCESQFRASLRSLVTGKTQAAG